MFSLKSFWGRKIGQVTMESRRVIFQRAGFKSLISQRKNRSSWILQDYRRNVWLRQFKLPNIGGILRFKAINMWKKKWNQMTLIRINQSLHVWRLYFSWTVRTLEGLRFVSVRNVSLFRSNAPSVFSQVRYFNSSCFCLRRDALGQWSVCALLPHFCT